MLDGALSVFDGRFAQSDKMLQPWRNPLVGMRLRVAIAALLAEITRKSAIEIDHSLPCQRADAALRAEYNDFHAHPSYLFFAGFEPLREHLCSRFRVQSSRLEAGPLNKAVS
jgi:hypothetical protein